MNNAELQERLAKLRWRLAGIDYGNSFAYGAQMMESRAHLYFHDDLEKLQGEVNALLVMTEDD